MTVVRVPWQGGGPPPSRSPVGPFEPFCPLEEEEKVAFGWVNEPGTLGYDLGRN